MNLTDPQVLNNITQVITDAVNGKVDIVKISTLIVCVLIVLWKGISRFKKTQNTDNGSLSETQLKLLKTQMQLTVERGRSRSRSKQPLSQSSDDDSNSN